jgi:hypothetical protein
MLSSQEAQIVTEKIKEKPEKQRNYFSGGELGGAGR